MSSRLLAAVCAAAAGAAIWSAPGRAADLVGTPPVSVPTAVAAAVETVEAAVPAVSVEVAEQAVAPAAQAVSATTAMAIGVRAPTPRADPGIPAAPRPKRPAVAPKPIERTATPIQRNPARADTDALLLDRSTASPPQSEAAARSTERPRRKFPQFPPAPFGAAALDSNGGSPLPLLLALALLFAVWAALEFAAPLGLAPQLLRPQRFSTRLERPG